MRLNPIVFPRQIPIGTCVLLVVAWMGAGPAAAREKSERESPTQRPNIVLIMADDLGWSDTGFNGNTIVHTPVMDRLASQGLVLKRFYAAAPVCYRHVARSSPGATLTDMASTLPMTDISPPPNSTLPNR